MELTAVVILSIIDLFKILIFTKEINMIKKIGCTVILTALMASTTFAQGYSIDSAKSIGGRSITGFDRTSTRTIGGYFDTELVMEENKASTFKAHRMVLELASQLNDQFLFNTEIEFEYGGYVTNTDKADNKQAGEIKIEQAWFDYKISDALIQRTGIIVVPFGHVNVLHDSDVRDMTQRPLYAKYIVPTTWMDTGFGFHGVVELRNADLNYDIYVVNGLADSGSDISNSKGLRNTRPNFKNDNNGDKAIVGRLGLSPRLGIDIGTSFYKGNVDDGGTNSVTLLGFDGVFKKGRYEVITEYAAASIEEGDIDSMNGGYVEAHAHVLQNWLKNRLPGTKNPVITLFTRHGMVNLDVDNDYITYRHAIGFNFRPTETVAYKIEYQVENYEQPNKDTSAKAIYGSIAVGF